MKRVLIIVPDYISALEKKGEVIDRYYNPREFFDEVHVLMINNDHPNPSMVQKMVGRAKLHLYNFPAPRRLFWRTLGFQPTLLNRWADRAIPLARQIKPQLVRCHGVNLNAYIASRIKKALGAPYVASLHINPDEDMRGRAVGLSEKLYLWGLQKIEKIAIEQANLILPVYEPIIPYVRRFGGRYEVCYNVLNPTKLGRKTDYRLQEPVRIISVGRQFREKNPENIIRALRKLPNVHLTLVGDGAAHEYLRQLVIECGVETQVTFHRALDNDQLCRELPSYDIFVVHTEYWELNKSVLEALLVGLPVVINRRKGEPVPELKGDFVLMVDNTVEGYYDALSKLIDDNSFRKELGLKAYTHAQQRWAPAKTEAKFAEIYQRIITENRAPVADPIRKQASAVC